jgi:predicted phosphodiesterase
MQSASKRTRTRRTPAVRAGQISPMKEITANREVTLHVLNETIRVLEKDHPRTRRTAIERMALRSGNQWRTRRDDLIGKLQRAQELTRQEPMIRAFRAAGRRIPEREPEVYLPRNRAVALIQSAMDDYMAQKKPKTLKLASSEDATTFTDQFEPDDPGWISVALQKLKNLFTGNARFIAHKSTSDFLFTLEAQAKIALVADWGTGTPSALAVAAQIQAQNPDHVIHLGDVYYAGTKDEVENRFLSIWRNLQIPAQFWALNSNHEMYSGGHGYFEKTLKEFKQPASYFSLENENWRFIGLDSGYVDHNLNKEQVEWLDAQLSDNRPRTFLMTHHQLFSAYEDQGEKMEEKVASHLNDGSIFGWFWGHEHACIIFDTFKNIQGRCIGHGGLPYAIPADPPPNANVPVKFVDRRPRPDKPSRGMQGFAMLTVDGPHLHVDYIDQDGTVIFTEDFTR